MLAIKSFVLIILVMIVFSNTSLYALHDLKDSMSTIPSRLRITFKNKNYVCSSRLVGLIEGNEELTQNSMDYLLYMLVPEKGQSRSQFYTGPCKHLKFTFLRRGFPWCYVKENSKEVFSNSIRHIVIYFSLNNSYHYGFPDYSIRYIDNEGFVESLRLLASKAVNKFRGHQITEKQIKDRLPLEMQEYLEEMRR